VAAGEAPTPAGGPGDAGGHAAGPSAPPAPGSAVAAPAPPEDAAGRPTANTIRWATASEVDSYGFHVYRGDSVDGPFERLTAAPIPGAGTSDLPHRYEYVDDSIEPGREYFYYVESVSIGGEREPFTPVRRAPPKPAADDGPSP
jgi:hypothetical protein